MCTDFDHTPNPSGEQPEPQTNPQEIYYRQLVETITQQVIGDAQEVSYVQAQEIVRRVAEALVQRTAQKGGE